MAMDTWRLSRIQEELDKLDFTRETSEGQKPLVPMLDNTNNPPNTALAADKLAKDARAITVANFIGDEGFSDDEESLPPYPEVSGDECFIPEGEEFPTPVPAQIGIVRPLPGLAKQQAPPPEDIYSVALTKPEKQILDEAQAAQLFTEKYDSLGKLKSGGELTTIPAGYVNMNSPTKLVPTRVAPPIPVDKTTPNTVQLARPISDLGLSFSAIIEQNSPARSLSIALANNPPPSPIPMPLKRGSREQSWSDMDPKSCPSKGVLPGDLTGYPSSSIMKTVSPSSLTEHEILQVEMFYRSHKTEVFVCHCIADMYYGSMKAGAASSENFYSSGLDSLSNWKLIKPGIPVLLLDSGKSRRERQLHLLVAERGTGFALWREQINQRTDYQAREAMFHTMHLSSDHSKLAALKFHDAGGASDFLQKLNSILTNPDMEDMFSLSSKKKKKDKKRTKTKVKTRLPDKNAISAPCCFTHITNLDRNDGLGVLELSANATKKDKEGA